MSILEKDTFFCDTIGEIKLNSCKFHDHDKEKVKEEDIGDVDVRDDSAILIIIEWRQDLEFSYVKKK